MSSVNLDTASLLNITCRRGDTFTLELDFGEAVATSGWQLTVKNREQVTAARSAERKPAGSVIAVDDGGVSIGTGAGSIANAKATVTIDAAVMAEILPGIYSYDFQNTSAGVVKTYLFGSFKVNADV